MFLSSSFQKQGHQINSICLHCKSRIKKQTLSLYFKVHFLKWFDQLLWCFDMLDLKLLIINFSTKITDQQTFTTLNLLSVFALHSNNTVGLTMDSF